MCSGCAAALTKDLQHPFGEFLGPKRLGDKPVDLELHRSCDVLPGGMGREDEDGNPGGVRVQPQISAKVEPTDVGEEQVDDEQIGRLSSGVTAGLMRILKAGDKQPAVAKNVVDGPERIGVVIYGGDFGRPA